MKGIILTLTAMILFMVFAPFGILWQVFTNLRGVNNYFFDIAISIDQSGNVVCGKLLDMVMRKRDGHPFSNPDETISSCIGKNHRSNTLTWCGKVLHYLLNKIENDHSEKAIEEDEMRKIL